MPELLVYFCKKMQEALAARGTTSAEAVR